LMDGSSQLASDPLPLLVPTSVHLSRMLDRAVGARVSVGWLISELGERSFGLTLLVMAIIALPPGASTIVGLLIGWPAIQLILGHDKAALPRAMARREIEVERLARVIDVVVPRLVWVLKRTALRSCSRCSLRSARLPRPAPSCGVP
jgi:hypothetical protein